MEIYKQVSTRWADTWLCCARAGGFLSGAIVPDGIPSGTAKTAREMGGFWVLSQKPFWPESGCGWCLPLKKVSARRQSPPRAPEVFGTPNPAVIVGRE